MISLPHVVSGVRHVDVRHAQVREGIVHCIGEARNATYVRRFSNALGPERMMGRGRHREIGFPYRRLHRGGQEVVHYSVAEQIAAGVDRQQLPHRHGVGFGEAAVDLALDDHGVDAGPAVVERIEAPHIGFAGVAIAIDHAQIGAEGVSEIGRDIIFDGLEAHLHAGRHVVVRRPGDFLHGFLLAWHALDLEAVDVPVEIVGAHIQQMRGDLARHVTDHARGVGGGSAAYRHAARTVGAKAVGRGAGVALFHLNHFGRQTQFRGDDLRISGRMALTLRDRAHACDGAAGGVDTDLATVEHADAEDVAVLARAGADDLGEGADANAHQLAALALLRLFFAQALIAHRLQHLLERSGVIAAVVLPAERAVIRHLFRLDEVAYADFRCGDVELLREDVDHAFDY